jgi:flagellar protein FlgJ
MDPLQSQPLAADSKSLDSLRLQAGRDPKAAIRQAAVQFESLFMKQLLKSMRDAMPKSGLWGSSSEQTYTDMFDQQMAQQMSGRPGGLSDVLARQLSRQMGVAASEAGSNGSADPANAGVQTGGMRGATPGFAHTPAQWQPVGSTGAMARAGAPAKAPGAMPDLTGLSTTQADFVKSMWPSALLAQQTTGVPAEYIVGQAALESSWGRSEPRTADGGRSFNLFGVKAGAGWNGPSIAATTTEYTQGQATRQVERFRAYGSYAESFQDWAKMVAGSPRYGQTVRDAGSVSGFAQGMQKAGYATDPAYGEKLERTINQTLMLRRLVI